ncbi:MAG: hypothetical protein WAV23_03515 [Minisyncoccia bacterium]
MIPENKKQNKIVQTYAGDMAKVIEINEGGLIKKIIHEKEEQEQEKENLSPESRRNKTFMLISIVFVILAVGSVAFILILKQQISTVPVALQFSPLIFTDEAKIVEVGGLNVENVVKTIYSQVNATKVKKGGVEGIYLTENKSAPIGLKKFLSLINANLNQSQIPLVSDNFLIGITKNDTNDLFILLKTRSFFDIFSALQAWEGKMFFDLHGLFGVDISTDTSYLLTKNFEDGIVVNKNARILYDKDGKIVLMYVFADENSVIITNKEDVANEVMLRLASSKIKK